MIRLNQTATQLLSLITAQNGAVAVVSYSDKTATAYTGDTQVTAITSATTTTICSTPAASTIRDIDHVSIKNTYAGSQSVTVQISSSATLYPLVTFTLAEGDSIEYTHGSGWQVLDSTGQLKTSVTVPDGDKGDITVSAAGGTWTIDSDVITAAARTVLDDATVSAMVDTLGGASSTGTGGLARATSPVLTTPQINDTSADHQYIVAVSELTADRTVTFPLLTGDDEFVFKDHAQALTNKTLNGHTFTAGSSTFTGTAGQTYTFPTTTASIARTDSAQTFSGTQTFDVLTATGNVTLGNATSDTVYIPGYMSVGTTTNAAFAAYIRSTALTGTTQTGVYSYTTGTSAATSNIRAFTAQAGTAAAAFTVGSIVGFIALDAVKGAGSTITNLHGVYIADLTAATNNYGITSAATAGANKWNIYASGGAINYLNGALLIGSATDDGVHKLQVTGSINSTTTISTGGYIVATLPAGAAGDRAYVTDATTPTWLAALTGGGAVVCPVFHNGTAWLSA